MSNFSATEPNVPMLVVEADPAVRSRLVMQLGEHAIPLETMQGVEERYGAAPFVLILGPSCSRGSDLGGAESLLGRRSDIGAILIAEDLSTDLFQRAMRSGVRDVLGSPVDTGQLNEAVSRIGQTLVAGGRPVAIGGSGLDPDGGDLGRVITVFSTKGGAGKSVMATNLGVLLAQRAEGTV